MYLSAYSLEEGGGKGGGVKRGRKCKGGGTGGGSNGCDKVNKCTYQHIPWRKGEG